MSCFYPSLFVETMAIPTVPNANLDNIPVEYKRKSLFQNMNHVQVRIYFIYKSGHF